MRQNRRFWERDKTADFENETSAHFKVGHNFRFCKREQTYIKIVSLIRASWPNYRQLAIILPITNKN